MCLEDGQQQGLLLIPETVSVFHELTQNAFPNGHLSGILSPPVLEVLVDVDLEYLVQRSDQDESMELVLVVVVDVDEVELAFRYHDASTVMSDQVQAYEFVVVDQFSGGFVELIDEQGVLSLNSQLLGASLQ